MVWYWWQIWLIYWWNFVGSAPQWALDGAPTAEYLVWILNCHILSELIWVISDIFMAHHVISQPSEHEHHEPFKYCGPCCHLPLVTYVWSMHKKGHSTWFFFQSAAQKQSPELGEFTGRNEFARRAYLKKKKKRIDSFMSNGAHERQRCYWKHSKTQQTGALSGYRTPQYLYKEVQVNSCTQEIYNDPLCAP